MRDPGAIDLSSPVAWSYPLNAGRVAWWFGLPGWAGGGTYTDLCRGGNATLNATAQWATTPDGFAALKFAGGTGYAEAPDSTPLHLNQPSTVEIVLRVDSYADGCILSKFAGLSGGSDNRGFRTEAVGPHLYVTANNANYFDLSPWVPAGSWCHIVLTNSTAGATAYVDGVSRGTATMGGSWFDTTRPLRIGAPEAAFFNSGTSAFDGVVGGVALFNTAVSQGGVAALYDQFRRRYPDTLRRLARRTWLISGTSPPPPPPTYHTWYAGRGSCLGGGSI